jgi:HlyD family secretion protein
MKNPKLWRRVGWLAGLLVLVVGIALGVTFGRKRPEVEVARVKRGSWERVVEEDGRARARERFVISSPVSGVVQRQTLHAGDCVERGDPLVTVFPGQSPLIDERSRRELEARRAAAEAGVEQARSGVKRAEAARAHADVELAQARELMQAGAITSQALQHAQLEADVAKSDSSAAAFAFDVAVHQRDVIAALLAVDPKAKGAAGAVTLRAPIKGCVLRVAHEDEGAIAPGAPLIELADPAELEVVVDLLSTDAIHVQVGAEAKLQGFGSRDAIEGRVRRVEPTASVHISALGVEEQRVDVIVDPIEPTKDWARVGDGYRVDVHIAVEHVDDTLTVPTSALFREGTDWAALVLENGRVRRSRVAVTGYGALQSAIGDGLPEGTTVVLEPARELKEGVLVAVRGAK